MRTVTKDGKDYLVHYGDPDMEMKRDDPDRRKAFLERHSCSTKKDPLAPGFWACLDWQRTDEGATVNEQDNEAQPANNATLFTVPEGAQFNGAIVALFPSPELAQQIAAMPGVQMTADALHVTLAYLGKVDSLTDAQLANAIVAAQQIARDFGKLTGAINGMGRFNASQSSDGKDVIYAVVDVPGLERLREAVVQRLRYADVPVSMNHGFTPHMTLSEVEPGTESPISMIPTMPLEFGSISVSVATRQVDFPLAGDGYMRANAAPPWPGDRTAIAANADCGCNTVQLTTNATAGTVKEVTRKGTRYLVAPTVALRSGVLNGEFVPADEVAKYADAWNGRPVPLGHPKQDGQAISANSMDLWDKTPAMFWGATVDGDALKGEFWVDIAKAEKLGGEATLLLQRLRNNEAIDVSTGYFRDFIESPGTHDGKAYTGIARNLRPDHIAILLNETGACSWADGCGVPRINEAKAAENASQSFLSALVRNVINSLGGKKVDRTKIIEGLAANAQCKCSKQQLEAMDDATLTAFASSLQPVVNEEAPAVEPAPVEVVKEVVPAELAQLAKVVADFGGIDKLTAALSGVVANADKERADLVAGLVANERNTLSEAELKAMPVETLRKLTSAFAARFYVGSGNVATNATEEPRYTTMAMPLVFPKKEAK
jgi:2'-5' RNA ligase